MTKIRKGDEVIVIAGRDKGKQGKVTRMVHPDRLMVEGVNMIKRHTRANPRTGTAGGIVEREAALHISNVLLYNPVTKKGDRVGVRILDDGRKVRFFKSTDETVDI